MMISSLVCLVAAMSLATGAAPESGNRGASIDSILQQVYTADGIEAGPLCSDEEFLRRVSLDLIGRIPTTGEIAEYSNAPDRRAIIDRMLASEDFDSHIAESWTTWLIGYSNAYQIDRELFRSWLEEQIRDDQSFDAITKQLITASGSTALDGPVNFLARHRDEPAIKVSRTFLGVRLDCARCHDHPFDRWTEDDFQKMSLFFRSMQNRDNNGVREITDRTIRSADMNEQNTPRFLTGSTARTGRWRDELALYIVNCKPFARNFSNRIWYQLMGRGVVEPPDDFNQENPPSVPGLLEYLTGEAVANQFQIKPLIRLICNSQAYQRTSIIAGDGKRKQLEEKFAVRKIKPLSTEQFIASVATATDTKLGYTQRRQLTSALVGTAFDEDQSEAWQYNDTVQQLMQKLALPLSAIDEPTEQLFLRVLSRMPTEAELEICRGQKAEDVLYALVNSNEFFFSH